MSVKRLSHETVKLEFVAISINSWAGRMLSSNPVNIIGLVSQLLCNCVPNRIAHIDIWVRPHLHLHVLQDLHVGQVVY